MKTLKNFVSAQVLSSEKDAMKSPCFPDKKLQRRNASVIFLWKATLLSALLLFSAVLASAQALSGVTGVVADQSGALVPNVEVKLTDTKTSRELTTKTNEQGVYTFNNVPPGGGYMLTFTLSGFQTFIISEVQLGIGRTETHNAELTTGNVSGTVTVTDTSGAATLNTTDASVGNVINNRQLRELPIQLRDNPAALIGLQPGVIGDNVGTTATNRVGSVTGSRADQGNITVDGIDANDQATGQAFVTIGNVPIDSVQELRTVTSNPGATEGRSGGGQIQLATNSGTNDFHGSLREFYRTEKTSANTFFNNKNGLPVPKFRRNQFGGSLSGPIKKEKLFFFFDYEGRRDNFEVPNLVIVPLQNFREGRIGYINNNAGCTFASRANTTPNCISYLTPAQSAALDPRGIGPNAALLSFINSRYPQANDLTVGNGVNTGGYRYNAPAYVDSNTFTIRGDWNITSNQRFFARATITRFDQTNAVELLPGDGDSEVLVDKSLNLATGHTWVISPSITNQAAIGLSKQAWDFPVPIPSNYPNYINNFGPLTLPFADPRFQDRDVLVPTFRDDVTWTLGTHTLQFGGQFKPIRQKSTFVNDLNYLQLGLGGNLSALDGSLRPGNLLATDPLGRPEANFDFDYTFLLGRFAQQDTVFIYDYDRKAQSLGTGRKRDYAYNEYELYIQDNWRVRSDLTLNFGVRWHLYPAPYEKNGIEAANDVGFEELFERRRANANAGISGATAEPLLSYSYIGKANDRRPLYNTDKNNFAPKISFNYAPSFKDGLLGTIFGDRKTVLRGGYSVNYDRVSGAISFIQAQNSYLFDNTQSSIFGNNFGAFDPFVDLFFDPRFTGIANRPVQSTPIVITDPFTPNVENGQPFGLALGGSGTGVNYAVDQNFKIPYTQSWNFGFQRELPGNMLLEATYVGRRGRNLLSQVDASQALNFKDPASGQLMFDAFNALQAQILAGTSAANTTPQPWIENQLNKAALANYGAPCSAFGVPNCTRLVRSFFGTLARDGGTADLVQQLFANSLLDPNVGMSAQFSTNAYITNQGEVDYNGLLVSLQKRFSKGFEFDVNYTWSHAIDNNSSVANTLYGALLYDATNPKIGRGDADFDIRHLFNANVIWDMPVGRGRSFGGDMPKWLDAFVGGWTVSGIIQARSGYPITSFSGSYPVGFISDSPTVLVSGNTPFESNIRDEGTGIQYFADPAAVQAALRRPRHGETGNRNIFRSEGFYVIDMAISKKFQMPWSETHRLTFRAEGYNVTNSHFFGSPNLSISSSTFGQLTTSQSTPRRFQFALRYDF